mgnify:CR=1 FL=1
MAFLLGGLLSHQKSFNDSKLLGLQAQDNKRSNIGHHPLSRILGTQKKPLQVQRLIAKNLFHVTCFRYMCKKVFFKSDHNR